MFKTRLLSGIVLVIAAIFLIVTGNEVLLFSTLLISCIGMFELFRVFKFEKSLLSVVPYIALILFYINLRWSFIPDVMMLFMGFLIVLMFVYVLSYPKYDAKQLMAAFFGMFYVGTMLSYVYQIRTLNNGLYLAFLVFLCSWGCDTCAYCVGVLIGKQNGTKAFTKEVYRGCSRWCTRQCASYSIILLYIQKSYEYRRHRDCYTCCYSCCCRPYFNGWRFVRISHKA